MSIRSLNGNNGVQEEAYFLNKAKETEIQNQLCIEQERKKNKAIYKVG